MSSWNSGPAYSPDSYSIRPGNIWQDPNREAPMLALPVAAHVHLVVCKAETGYVISVMHDKSVGMPKVYAGNDLTELVQTVMATIVAGKMEE